MSKRQILLCVGAAFLGGLAAVAASRDVAWPLLVAQEVAPRPRQEPVAAPRPDRRPLPMRQEQGLTPDEQVNIAVYENVNRSVVNINTKTSHGEAFFIELYSEGAGSGVVIDRQGRILTNYHVIEDARQIQVSLFDGKTYEGRIIGQDPSSDVAVLSIEAPEESLFPVVFGDSSNLRVGQRVFAIGNPFGLERTLTTGIISSLNRSLPARNGHTIRSIIQIDAAINPGNSGGPLLDTRSRLIGINTAIASATGQNTGVGFAVPVSTIARVVPQLVEQGRVVRPDVGIGKVYETEEGLLIATLVPGGSGEVAGLRGPKIVKERKQRGLFSYETQTIDRSAADLIVGVDGNPIKTADEFLSQIESHQPGEQTVLTVIREGQPMDVPVRLGAGE